MNIAGNTWVTPQRTETKSQFRLEVVEGPAAGQRVDCTRGELSVGRQSENDIVLSGDDVSPYHAEFVVTEQGVLVRDLGSSTGTWLGGFRAESGYVSDGATIRIGSHVLRFTGGEEPQVQPASTAERFGDLVGRSIAMRRVFRSLERAARDEFPLLIEGERGTGKQTAAMSVHRQGPRGAAPYVVVHCSAMSHDGVEKELFGDDTRRPSAFERAAGGTLYLRNISELPLSTQRTLAQAIESFGARGKTVRIIASDTKPLRAEVNRGAFSADLFRVFAKNRVVMPPMRLREKDIGLLCAQFVNLASGTDAPPPMDLVADLEKQSLPGNVADIRGHVGRALGMVEGDRPAHGEVESTFSVPFRVAKERAVGHWERRYLQALMAETVGNLSRAARLVKMDRNYLRELLRRHQVER